MRLVAMTITDAKVYVTQIHRHHAPPPVGTYFSLGAVKGDDLVGVVMVGMLLLT